MTPNQMTDVFADFVDGETARLQRVRVSQTMDRSLRLDLPDGETALIWPMKDLRLIPDQADRASVVLGLAGDHPARLMIDDLVLTQSLTRTCPNLKRHDATPGVMRRLAVLAVSAVASVALIVFVLVPVMADQLAVLLPKEGERALGDSTFEQIRTALADNSDYGLPLCNAGPGRRALDKMLARLDPSATLVDAARLHVLDHEMVNAFALPGGHVVLFRGLLQEAESPEEVAGVLGHEIGHVVNRDPTRLALRSAGSIGVLGLLLGDFAGGAVVLYLTEKLIQARYSRDAEANADLFAHEIFAEAKLPSARLGDFFDRLNDPDDEDTGLLSHLASHPDLLGRAEAARAADVTDASFYPVLTDQEWQALRNICTKSTNRLATE